MCGWLYRSTSIYMLPRLRVLPLVLHETLPLVHVRPVTRPLQVCHVVVHGRGAFTAALLATIVQPPQVLLALLVASELPELRVAVATPKKINDLLCSLMAAATRLRSLLALALAAMHEPDVPVYNQNRHQTWNYVSLNTKPHYTSMHHRTNQRCMALS